MQTPATIRSCLLLMVLATLPACGGGGSGGSGSAATGGVSSNPAPPPAQANTLQEALDLGVARGADGMILAVRYRDGSTESYAAGVRDRASGAAMEPRLQFKIASVSKLFIAAAATQVFHQGLLSLNDSLAQQLPALAPRIENAAEINLRHLLRHRSGVPDFDSQAGFSWHSAHTDVPRVLEYALDKPADFPPDERYEYSNTNYLLLGMVLDEVLGYSHHQHIQNFILDPLGLSDTVQLLEDADAARLASGYWDGVDTTRLDYAVPGGSMVSTAADVAAFLHALAGGRLLSPAEQATYNSVYWLQHSGWLPGYQTIANYEAIPGASVVLHLNNTGGSSEQVLSDTYEQVLSILRK
jgi:CubicO group peptidase (beta-lactamase class C family)